MSQEEQVERFAEEIDNIVDRYRKEFDLTYASVIGVLQIKAHGLCGEAYEAAEEE